MDFKQNFKNWKENTFFDIETRNELLALNEVNDEKEIEDRFYQELEFGTAGLRGIMGAGTNRMNKYTVAKATAGFAKFLLKTYGENVCKTKGVVVAHDTRNNSEFFASVTADVFSANGVKVFFLDAPSPIPVMSNTIRSLGAMAGVVVTASHNPREYNGYKAYDETGCQLVPAAAAEVTAYVNEIQDYSEINYTRNSKLVETIDVVDEFVSVVLKQSRISDKETKENLKVVYTPIHGSGYVPVKKALERDGFANLYIVEEQAEPNGDFPTVSAPNPEKADALEMGINKAKSVDADIVLGTDPDADRVGVAVKTSGGYKLLTGNHVGVLLVDFLIEKLDRNSVKKPAIVKSIVTSELGAEIARKKGVSVFSTLTGFRFIGERITQFETAKKTANSQMDYDYLIGYEESYGYLVGTHARDKDAVVSCMLIAEMAAELKTKQKTLLDRLNEIYQEYGYYIDTQESFTLKGKEGLEKIAGMMRTLRESDCPFENAKVIDYKTSVKAEDGFGYHPTSNVIMYFFEDNSWVAVRPSGTEPKIKIYYSIKGVNEAEASKRLESLKTIIKSKIGL